MYRERISTLKSMAQSPAHYWHARNNPRPKTAAMTLGSLVHALVLGGRYDVFEGAVRRGKEWDRFEADARAAWIADRKPWEPEEPLIVKVEELDKAREIAASVLNHPLATPLLIGKREHYIEFDLDGRPFRSTLDVLGADFVTDLKTSSSSSPDLFPHHARRLRYDAQLATYAEAAAHEMGLTRSDDLPPPIRCFLTVVETAAPYVVTVLQYTPTAIMQARKSVRLWNERAIQCERENAWPGYAQSIIDLDVEQEIELEFAEDGLE